MNLIRCRNIQFWEVLTASDVLDFLRNGDVKTRKKKRTSLSLLPLVLHCACLTRQNHEYCAVGVGANKAL